MGDLEADTGLADADDDDGDSELDDELDVCSRSIVQGPRTNLEQIDVNGDTAPSAPGTDSEEESIVVTRQEEEIDPEDEADFDRELAKLMAESLDSRKHERKPTFDVPLPMRRKENAPNAPTPANESWTEESSNGNAPAGTMAFSLLTKRGNRQQVSTAPIFENIDLLTEYLRPAQLLCLLTPPLPSP